MLLAQLLLPVELLLPLPLQAPLQLQVLVLVLALVPQMTLQYFLLQGLAQPQNRQGNLLNFQNQEFRMVHFQTNHYP